MRKWLAALMATFAVAAGSIVAPSASALPLAPEPVLPVTGVPAPCATTYAWPEDASIEEIKTQITANFGFTLSGSLWTEERRPSIKISTKPGRCFPRLPPVPLALPPPPFDHLLSHGSVSSQKRVGLSHPAF